jgi:hypothetical protein
MIVGILPIIFRMPSLFATVITAPLLLLVPAGVGNACAFGISGILPARLSKLQAMLIAYFVGTLLIILAFLICERLLGASSNFGFLSISLYILSIVGWLRLGEAYRLTSQQRKWMVIVTFISLPLVVLRYWYSISIYSDYPIIDLFQRSHFHGGAFEFALSKTLNPFAADSYIPFQQLFLGLLMMLAGADPLDAEWVWPLAMAPVQIGSLLCFVKRLVPNRRTTLVALGVSLAQLGLSNPTNGTMAEMVVLVLLSVLWPRPQQTTSDRMDILLLLASAPAVLIGLTVTKLPVVEASLLILAAVFVGNLAERQFVSRVWPVVMLTMIALPFHRGALLYVALAVALCSGLHLISTLRRRFERIDRQLALLTLGIVGLLAAMCLKIIITGRDQADVFGMWGLFDLVLTPITGKSLTNVAVDGDLAPGVGARVALFEVARAVSPLALIVMLIGLLLMLRPTFGRPNLTVCTDDRSRQVELASNTTLLFFGTMVFILTGFPFIHRAGFLVTIIAAATLANMACNAPITERSVRNLSFLSLVYMLVLLLLPPLLANERAYPYLMRAFPVVLVTASIGAMAVAITLAGGAMRRLPLIIGVVAAVAMEFAVSRSYFKSYAFQNQPMPASGPLAAYDRVDLEISKEVLAFSSIGDLLVSDPKTTTILRSRTGLYPLVALSNLDTIADDARVKLANLLSSAVSDAAVGETCGRIRQMANVGASGIYNYGKLRLSSATADGATVLLTLGYKSRLVPTYDPMIPLAQRREAQALISPGSKTGPGENEKISLKAILLINLGTLDWLANPDELRYFPVRSALPNDVLLLLERKYPQGRLIENTFVARLEC